MNYIQWGVLGAFLAMSLVGFFIMGVDKAKAKRGAWRIKEATLFLVAFLLGGVGSTLGMFAFRHKTKHLKFKFFLPILAIYSIAVTVVLIYVFKG